MNPITRRICARPPLILRWVARAGGCVLLLLGIGGACVRAAELSTEYEVKAAFLYNFAKFVEWPAGCFLDDAAPFRIAVVGTHSFGEILRNVVRDRKVNGRGISIVMLSSLREAKDCSVPLHVLFVGNGEEKYFEQLGPALQNSSTLTVGESHRFAAQGGIVNFITIDDKVRFEINAAAADRAGLRISAQLQKLASLVRKNP